MIAPRSKYPTAAPYLPQRISLTTLKEAVQECRGCDLYQLATQAVFGEGRKSAKLMLVGEQPGDQEDQTGKPFVGPAGRVLDEVLQEVGIPRNDVYVTNAVKHFRFTLRGKRRIHGKPTMAQTNACRPWLEAEISVIKPQMIVAMGATAAMSLFGPTFRLTQRRGQPFVSQWARWCMATVHPSSLLRVPDEIDRGEAWSMFLEDFQIVADEYASSMKQQLANAKRSRR